MKKLAILLLIATLGAIVFSSCKKEEKTATPAPTTTTNPPPVTYTNMTIDLGLVDYNDASGNGFTTVKAIVIADGVSIDSLTGMAVTNLTSGALNTIPDACMIQSSISMNTKSFKTKDGTTNYIDIYDGNTRLVRYTITSTKINKDDATISAGTTCYSLPCQTPNRYGVINR